MPNVKIYDTEKGYRYIIPRLRKAGIPIDVKRDVILGHTLSGLISLMDTLQKTIKPDIFSKIFKAILYGNTGSGKTYTATNILIGLIQEKTDKPILLIDSATVIYQNYVEAFKAKNGIKRMKMNHWGEVIPAFNRELGRRIRDHDYNIILTGRMGYVYELVENEDGKKEFQKTDTKAKLSSETAYEPDVIVEMEQLKKRDGDGSKVDVVQQAVVLKDRSDIIHGKSAINPDWSFFKPVWDYIDLDVGEAPKDQHSDTEIIEVEEQRSESRTQKEILLEKIWAEFDSLGLGATKEGKVIKVEILDRIFMTKSKTEIERMSLETLQHAHDKLIEDSDVKKYKQKAKEAIDAATA